MEKPSTYSFSQAGYLPILIFTSSALIVAYFIYLIGFNFVLILLLILCIAAALAFSRMDVKLTNTHIHITLGRILKRDIFLVEVASVEVNPDKLYSIWGAWPIARGWVFSVDGFNSITIYYKNGTKLILGCPEPELLVEKIKEVNKNRFSIKT